MKKILALGMVVFAGAAFAGEGWHTFSSGENPHAMGGCASKKDKVAQFHKFHSEKQEKAEQKVEVKKNDKKPEFERFI